MEKHEPNNEAMPDSDKQFYRGWIRDILMQVPDDISDLKQFRSRFDVSLEDHIELRSIIGGNSDFREALQGIVKKIQQEIDERLASTVEDLQRNVFEPGLFQITIVVEDQRFQVESVTVADEQVAPVVDGLTYTGPIDSVIFDR